MGEIREPRKRTSIEKKNKIIEKGFELICEKGYHNVTSVDIAKYAGVSTGIIYQYFEDKRDIFIAGINDYANKIMFPMINVLEEKKIYKKDLRDLITKMVDAYTKNHKMSKNAHEQLMAMSHLDEEVGKIFKEKEMIVTEKIEEILTNNKFNTTKEKVHMAQGILDNYCHEVVYHKHSQIDYKQMKEEVINILVSLLS